MASKRITSGRAHPVQTLDDKGKAPKERLRNCAALHSLYTTALQADQKSAHNRVLLQQDVDGAPPQSDFALATSGQSFAYNLNFLSSATKLQGAITAYSNLLDSVDSLIKPEFDPKKIPPDQAPDSGDIIAEEHSTLVREHSDFHFNWERLASEFVPHGVGFAYYPDEETPWWEAAGWNEFVMPRRTKASEEKIPALMWEHSYRVHELWEKIKDPKHSNFNVEEVQKAIVHACESPDQDHPWQTFWSDIQDSLQRNDIGFSYGVVEEVKALHALVREFDGSVSFYISLTNNSNAEYLYSDASRYEKMTDAVVTFTLGVGKGTYHSIRGMLWRLHPFGQTINRLTNKLLTQTDLAMSLLLQATDAESLDDMAITLGPAVGYLPPADKATVVTRQLPDVGTQGLPVLQHLNDSVNNATGQFQSSQGGTANQDNRHNVSKFQYQTEQEHIGSLTSNSVNRFYRHADILFNGQFKRIQKIGSKSARYPEVADFFKRCDERGVPAEVIMAVRAVKAVRAIGNGSVSMRASALDRLQAAQGSFDETGRNLVTRDFVTLAAGRGSADRYCPRQKRIAPDAQIALLENALLKTTQVPVLPDQDHGTHAGIHVPAFQQAVETLVAAREQNPEQDFKPLEPVLQEGVNLHQHAMQHVQAMFSNPLQVKDAKSYKAALEQGGNLLSGFARELQQQERHAVMAQGDQGAQQPGTPQQPGQQGSEQQQMDAINASDPRYTLQIQKQQEELVQARELHALELQLASAKVAQASSKMQIDGVKADAAVAGQLKKNQLIGSQ